LGAREAGAGGAMDSALQSAPLTPPAVRHDVPPPLYPARSF
jgi:hypothetical protein